MDPEYFEGSHGIDSRSILNESILCLWVIIFVARVHLLLAYDVLQYNYKF
jgi:hypothetical protein